MTPSFDPLARFIEGCSLRHDFAEVRCRVFPFVLPCRKSEGIGSGGFQSRFVMWDLNRKTALRAKKRPSCSSPLAIS